MSATPPYRPALGVGHAVDLSSLAPLPFEVGAPRRPVARDSFRLVLDAWPSLSVVATQLRERYATVHNWYRRDSVPRWYWSALVRSAERLGISGISHARFELLDRLRHAPPRKRVA